VSLYTENNRLVRSEKRIKNIKGWGIRLKNRIKNIEWRSTSNEEAPEYFGAKGALSLKNENIMCDTSKVATLSLFVRAISSNTFWSELIHKLVSLTVILASTNCVLL
jgi:hypothetical protein